MSRSRWLPIGLWLTVILVSFGVISRTTVTTDLSAFLPRSPSAAQQVLVEQLRDGVVSRLILIGIEGAPPAALAPLGKALAARLRADRSLVSVENGESMGADRDQQFLWRNRYLLSDAVTAERFSTAGLRVALENDLQLLTSPTGLLVKRVLPDDPTGELLHLLEGLSGQARPASREGVWFSPDGARALLVAQTSAPGFDIDAQQSVIGVIRAGFDEAKRSIGGAETARLVMSGPGVFSVATRNRIEGDAWRFSMLATVLVAGLLLTVYRSPRVLALALLPVASGALAGVAAVSLGFGSVHGITLGFGVTLIGEAVDYAIYLFTQTAPGSPPALTLPRIWPTLRLGVLTSICGFGALLFSSFTGLAQLGLFSISGLVVAVGVTRWVLPLLLPADFAPRVATGIARPTLAMLRHASRLRLPLLVLAGAGILLLVLRRESVWDTGLSSLSPIAQAGQQLDERLRRDIGAPDVGFMLVITAADQDHALQTAEAMAEPLAGLIGQGLIAGFDSPARYLPSRAAQAARQAALPAPDPLRQNLRQALDGLPFRPDLFAPFLDEVAAAKTQPPLDRAALDGTSLSLKLDSLLIQSNGLIPSNGKWIAMLPLRGVTDRGRLADAIASSAAASGGDVVLLDLKGETDRLYQTYRREAVTLSLLGGLAILVLLWASLRTWRRAAVVAAPLAAAVVLTAALLVAAGQALSIFHLVGLLLTVGIGSNYALFFERREISAAYQERTMASLTLANLCTVIGFGVLSASRIPVLHGIGITVALGTVLSLVFSAILIEQQPPGSAPAR
ncbi:MAG TPA: hypothetical protein VNT30_07295 [Stellaceae bacterium]|nr:hypothetical protein [Stellaceae bacterium]